MGEVKRRTYRSTLRTEQAAASRAAVLAAARRLFIAQGYGPTTIEQIATDAGVSKPTVFAAVGNKAEVFKVVRDVAMAGDDTPVPVTDRPDVTDIAAAPDLATAVRATAFHIARINAGYHEIDEVLRGASGLDAQMRALYETAEEQRLIGAGHLLDRLQQHGTLAIPREQALDRLWLLMAPDNYRRLVTHRGWPRPKYEHWISDEIATLF